MEIFLIIVLVGLAWFVGEDVGFRRGVRCEAARRSHGTVHPKGKNKYVLADGTPLEELKEGDKVVCIRGYYRDYGNGIIIDVKQGDTDFIEDIYWNCSWPLIFKKWRRSPEEFYTHISVA